MTLASDQAGFDFSDASQPIATEDPPGTWLGTRLTTAQYRQHVPVARSLAARLEPLLQHLFVNAIDQIEPRLAQMAETIEDDGGVYPLWGIELELSPQEWDAFAKGCEAHAWPGCETMVRHETWCSVYAVYLPLVGSLVGRRWEHSYGLSYDVQKDAELRPSYLDGAPSFDVPARLWRALYVGHTISEAHDKPASVRAFTFQGRSYIITGTRSKGRYIEALAWSVVAANDWRGPTYTYHELCKTWDDGRKERGDETGLVVSIGGQRCVLDGFVWFVDRNDDSSTCDGAPSDAERAVSDEFDDEDLDLDEEACDAAA